MSSALLLTLFISADVAVSRLCATLDDQLGVSTAPPSYRHITLKSVGRFSGNTAPLTAAVETAVADIDPFTLSVTGIGTFQNHVYLPVDDPDNSLRQLHETLCDIPLFDAAAYERADYVPHVTVAQTDAPLPEAVGQLPRTRWGGESASLPSLNRMLMLSGGLCPSIRWFWYGTTPTPRDRSHPSARSVSVSCKSCRHSRGHLLCEPTPHGMTDTLLETEHIRYNGNNVGIVGIDPFTKARVFEWHQEKFGSLGGGYSMSEGLFRKLTQKDVDTVYIVNADHAVSLPAIESSRKLTPADPVFYQADPMPSEPQYLYSPDE